MKDDRKLQGMKGERTAPRTPAAPTPSKGTKQPQGSGGFNVERTPYGKKTK